MISVLSSLTVGLVFIGIVLLQFEKKRAIIARLAILNGEVKLDVSGVKQEDKETLYSRLIDPRMKQFRRGFNRSNKGGFAEKLDVKILQAGSPKGLSPFDFRILQLILVLLLPTLIILLMIVGKVFSLSVFFLLLLSFIIGWYGPHYFLNMKIKKRYKKAVKELSDFVDLLAVSMEAGLGFDQALSQVVLKKQGVLADEFQRCLEELRLGKTRREALSGVRERLDVDDIKMLIGNIIQAEQLGVGMVQVLRIQSDEVRERRKQRAEEQAMKAPIKMLFPLVLFIFPCIFIVLLGPVILQLADVFK